MNMIDEIAKYCATEKEGVPAEGIAGKFLKFNNPARAIAQIAVDALLKKDLRFFKDDAGRWHARGAGGKTGGTLLSSLPLAAIYCMTSSDGRSLYHVSAWSVIPTIELIEAWWLVDPAMLEAGEQELLISALDMPFSPGQREAAVVSLGRLCATHVPVFCSSMQQRLLQQQFLSAGEGSCDDYFVASRLARASGSTLSRPLTLESIHETVMGSHPQLGFAYTRGQVLAECVAELLARCTQAGVDTREALEEKERPATAALFVGKEFSLETIKNIAEAPGVYGFKNQKGTYIYIGKATNLRRRLLSYFMDTGESPAKIESLRAESYSFTAHRCGSELESLFWEHRLILKYQPALNRQIEVTERPGTFAPIQDMVVLLPHAEADKAMSLWFKKDQKIILKPFIPGAPIDKEILQELEQFFFTGTLAASLTDFPEQEIAVRWLKKHRDDVVMIPADRVASATELYESMNNYWDDPCPAASTGE